MAVALQLLVNILIAGSVSALLGVGLQLVYATTRVLHLAHGAVALAAGYVAFDVMERGGSFGVAAVVAIAAAVLLGVMCEVFVYAPMRRRGATSVTLLLASLALLAVMTNLLLMRYSAQTLRPEAPITNAPWLMGGAAVTPIQTAIIALAVVLLLALGAALAWTRIGIAIRAVADHSTVARIVGIPVAGTQIAAFAIASAIGGAAGVLLAHELTLTPELSTQYAVKAFAAAIIGGAGSIPGAIIGGLAFGALQQVGAYLIGGGWHDAIAFGLLFTFLIWRPQGLFGRMRA